MDPAVQGALAGGGVGIIGSVAVQLLSYTLATRRDDSERERADALKTLARKRQAVEVIVSHGLATFQRLKVEAGVGEREVQGTDVAFARALHRLDDHELIALTSRYIQLLIETDAIAPTPKPSEAWLLEEKIFQRMDALGWPDPV